MGNQSFPTPLHNSQHSSLHKGPRAPASLCSQQVPMCCHFPALGNVNHLGTAEELLFCCRHPEQPRLQNPPELQHRLFCLPRRFPWPRMSSSCSVPLRCLPAPRQQRPGCNPTSPSVLQGRNEEQQRSRFLAVWVTLSPLLKLQLKRFLPFHSPPPP